ncbi:Hsp20/alpha crystallin family protein [Skermanella sp. TT6]|uniref:Hsp20/alpha crystallin family protein n=1 Tax=Skermanella cutis TaxID=2775420 RepID=A0ABX7B5B6_9PROT|nr:Hsp20/alpha crystallin family protein [Skermanella sp. TT6]QQP89318.1 Hsp20/alpha crystallin family protein [Skermanella sp. TT6]
MTGTLEKPAMKTETQPAATEEKGAAGRARHPLLSLRDEIDRLFDDFSAGMMRSPFRARLMDFEPFRRFESALSGAVPTAEIAEKEKEYVVTLELPGIDQKDVEISVSGRMMTVKGEKREEKEETEKQLHLSERRYGSFHRSFPIPETVDQDRIAAAMKDGVLTVTLPKTEAAARPARKIEVSGS